MAVSISIPVFVEKRTPAHERPYYHAQPIFFSGYEGTHEREDRALSQLEERLRKAFNREATSADHDTVAAWSFHPPMTRHHLSLTIRLKKQTFEGRFLFVGFDALDQRLIHCPKAHLTFTWPAGQRLEDRAAEALAETLRIRQKDTDFSLSDATSPESVRLTQITLSTNAPQRLAEDDDFRPAAQLGGGEAMAGAEELARVGRCLDQLYPHGLTRALRRESTIAALLDRFVRTTKSGAPVVLVGPSQVGKTAIIHAFVQARMKAFAAKGTSSQRKAWLIHPQRLISGMSFVGQWEERFFAIMREVREKRHLLIFEDLLGLFQAGKSAQSELTAGALLKVELQEHPMDVLAEATPEAWRRLRESDRAFADLFQVIPIREPSETESLRILIRVMQDLESESNVRIAPEVLPLIMSLQRRFVRTRAFPGKAIDFLKQLGRSHKTITVHEVRSHFQQRTGINTRFLDPASRLTKAELERFFQGRIVGQEAAVDAMMDAIMLSKARLTDPGRPLASLLFLGPTGVGKTECAKALVEFVFGSSDHLIRFDMNEFAGPDAVDRLTGNALRPHGLLTAAIRRRPYAVVLLDEIEKAHPDVFDLLLQVLGDARLTDHGGRTADFGNTLIILTSNLGARQSKVPIGFASEINDRSTVYVKAAEAFFRPELFNRIDRVIAFHELTRPHIERMVGQLAESAMQRHGIRSRKLMLEIDPTVYPHLADRGFEPEYGARALRRAIESELVLPLAQSLTQHPYSGLSILRFTASQDRLQLTTKAFLPVSREPNLFPEPVSLEQARHLHEITNAFLHEADAKIDSWMEGLDDLQSKLPFYALREDLAHIRVLRDRLQQEVEFEERRRQQRSLRGRRPSQDLLPPRLPKDANSEDLLTQISKASTTRHAFLAFARESETLEPIDTLTEALIRRVSRFEIYGDARPCIEQSLIFLRGNHPILSAEAITREFLREPSTFYLNALEWVRQLLRLFPEATIAPLDGSWKSLHEDASRQDPVKNLIKPSQRPHLEGKHLVMPGLASRSLLASEEGTHLFYADDGRLFAITVSPCDRSVEQALPIIRMHHEMGWSLDLRTGMVLTKPEHSWWPLLDASLPVSRRFQFLLG